MKFEVVWIKNKGNIKTTLSCILMYLKVTFNYGYD